MGIGFDEPWNSVPRSGNFHPRFNSMSYEENSRQKILYAITLYVVLTSIIDEVPYSDGIDEKWSEKKKGANKVQQMPAAEWNGINPTINDQPEVTTKLIRSFM